MNNNIEKLPPQNIEAEQSLLGSLIMDNNAISKIGELSEKDFYNDNHKKIFSCMKEMSDCDIISLTDRLMEKDLLSKIGGRAYLAKLTNCVITSTNVSKHAEIIRKKAILRRLNHVANEINDLSYKEDENIDKLLDQAEKKLNRITNSYTVKKAHFKIVKGDELIDMKELKTPYIVDKLIPEGAITAITADSGRGKSLITLILAYHIAGGKKLFDIFEVKQNRVLIIDQEMDNDVILGRYKAVVKEKNIPIDFIYNQFLQIDYDKDYKWLIKTIKEKGYKVVVFDTLTNLHSKSENSADEMKEVNKKLLNLIHETGVSIIYLHHHKKRQQGENFSQSSSRGSTEIIAKVASHILIDSKHWIEDEITHLKLTLQQEKARRPDRISKIGVKVFYDPYLKETHWEYLGEINDKEQKAEEAKKFILNTLESTTWLSIAEFKEKMNDGNLKIGENNLRDACRDLVKEKKIIEELGKNIEKEQKRAKYYNLNE